MQIDWWTLAFQVVNFLAVVWLLSRLLFRPIRRVIEEREAADRAAAQAAQAKVDEALAVKQDYTARLADFAEAQRREEADLHKQMAEERDALLAKARSEAEKLLDEARARIEAERSQTVDQLRAQIGELATGMAQKALGAPDIVTPGAALAQASARLAALSGTDLKDLVTDLGVEGAGVTVVTAADLPDPARDRWRQMLQERFGAALAIGFETDPALIGGAELRFPHAVLSFSVAARLREAVETVKG
ncbi:F0F1 ATP synthase subunit delta [Pseudodonghicola flavimaris]|uniref:ATP synthase subunit b n=1 Tax=Pseudodonghicola flavimaris TaxID=3050036 RepID=A0ABT7F5R3_9RHOB|nr:F0F1 ATP synthase subunit delta [Pseudodonghicola flavimaris]MDK3019946.1 F0F1 ATP synthase subunit delta [Pseudodonghicola flavimaris]